MVRRFPAGFWSTAEAVPLSNADRARAIVPTHAMKPHEWGTRRNNDESKTQWSWPSG
jgi:hypothetical protein